MLKTLFLFNLDCRGCIKFLILSPSGGWKFNEWFGEEYQVGKRGGRKERKRKGEDKGRGKRG